MNERIAERYAQALMDLGEERKTLDKLSEDLLSVESTIHGSRELRTLLLSPVVNPDQKLRILTEIFGKHMHAETMTFITLLVKKGRADSLLVTAEAFRRLLDLKRNITHAQITSAVTLSEDEQMMIQAKLEGMIAKRIRPVYNVDPALKGGFIARIGDTLVDASLRRQLEMLRDQFKKGGSPVMN